MKMEQIECSETSAYKIETPGNYPKENILYFQSCLYSPIETPRLLVFVVITTGLWGLHLHRDAVGHSALPLDICQNL